MNKYPKVIRGVCTKELSQKIKYLLFIINLKIQNMSKTSIFTKNTNTYYLTRLPKAKTVTTTWAYGFRVRVRTYANRKQPKTRRQTHKACVQAQHAGHGNISQNEQQHIMLSIVGRGWQWMSKVDIYGWECKWGDLRAWWVTGMRIGGAQVVVADENSGMPCMQNAQKTTQQNRR